MIVNKTHLGHILGKSEEWITQTQKDPTFPVLKRARGRAGNEYETSDVINWIQKRQFDNLTQTTSAIDIEEAKRRKLAAEAELAETELQTVQGKLVELAEVEKTWTDLLAACRAKLLALPSKLSPDLFAADSMTEVKTILKAGIIEALNELSEINETESYAAEMPVDPETTTESVGVELG